jgi:hypothetical protein
MRRIFIEKPVILKKAVDPQIPDAGASKRRRFHGFLKLLSEVPWITSQVIEGNLLRL